MSKFRSVPAGLVMSKYRKIAGEQASEYKRLSLTLGGVVPRRRDDTEGLQPASLEGYQVLPEGSLVFKLIDLENISTSRVGLSSETGIVSPAYIVTRVRSDRLLAKFGYYSFWDLYKRNYFNNIGSEGVRRALNYSDLARIRIPLPPLETQRRIADYLDRETAEIDAAVADLDKYVELLEKRRRVLISQSVTRGIGSDRTRIDPCTLPGGEGMSNLQNSGAYWLGEIPKDWKMLPAWALFAEGKEKCLSDDPHLVPSRVYGVVTRDRLAELSGNKPVDNEASGHHMKHVEPHNFIISMGSHESGIEHSRLVGKVSNDYRVLLPTSGVNPEYYKWFFKSEPLIEGLRGLTTEIRVGQRIHYSRFSLLRLPLPPAEDQQRIADYLDRETAEIDNLIAESKKLRDLLLKRRSVLITEVVTGRKQV